MGDRADCVTAVGQKLAALPIHPLYAYCLLLSFEFECVAEMLSIVAMLSAEGQIFLTSRGQREVAPASRPLQHEDGDHLSLLSVYSQWSKQKQQKSFAVRHA